MSQITLKDFRRGLANPADWNEAETLLNLVPLRDGSLERRAGLNTLEVALTTGGGSPITPEANRNIFWHNVAGIWVVCGGDGALYSANPSTGAVTQQLAGAAYAPWRQTTTDRLTSPLSLVGNGYYNDAGTLRYWSVNAAGTFAAAAVPLNTAYRTRGASRTLSFATYVLNSTAFLAGDGVSSAVDYIGGVGEGILGAASFGDGAIIGMTSGKFLLSSGNFASRAYSEGGDLAPEYFLPFTFKPTAIGTFFATTRSVYLFDGVLRELTEGQTTFPNSLFETISIANAELATLVWDSTARELRFSFEDSGGAWRTYIWSQRNNSWRKFEATLFDNGSYGLKQGSLYIALKGYGATVPGIYLVHGTNKADPNGDITCSYGHGYMSAKEGDEWDMELAAVYWIGAGWGSTLTLTYEDEAGTEQTATLTRDTYHRYLPPSLILARRMKTLGSTTIATSEPTKAVDLREITYFYTPRQRRA